MFWNITAINQEYVSSFTYETVINVFAWRKHIRPDGEQSGTHPQPSPQKWARLQNLLCGIMSCKYTLSMRLYKGFGTCTHTHTHRVAHICYIRQQGRESGSSNRAIRTPWDPIDLLIDPLLPQLVQTTLKVYTATTEKRTCNTSGWRWKELYKRHLGWHKKRSKCLSFMHPIFNLPSSHFHP